MRYRYAVMPALLASAALAAPPSTNPADLEMEAFEQLRTLDDRQRANLVDLDTMPLDAKARAYLNERKPALDLLRQAAKMPKAGWADDGGDVAPVMKNLTYARHATRIFWLQARLDAADGRPADAVEDLLTATAFARHVSQHPLLVSHLVHIGCEAGTIDRLAKLLPALPADVVAVLPARLDALPKASTLAAIIDGEEIFGRRTLAKQLAAASTQPEDAAMVPAAAEQVNALKPFYEALKAAADQSPQDFSVSVDAALAKVPGNIFAQILAPTFKRVREPSAVLEAKQAMLRTAIAISTNGFDAVSDSVDPFGDGAPFAITPAGDGYTLQSKLARGKEPVSLDVGR